MILRILFLTAIAVLTLGTIRGENTIDKFFELRKSREILNISLNNLKDQNERLEEEIEKIKKSPEYADKILRDRYHMKDPNESIIFFAD